MPNNIFYSAQFQRREKIGFELCGKIFPRGWQYSGVAGRRAERMELPFSGDDISVPGIIG